jgi:hypothetical protein
MPNILSGTVTKTGAMAKTITVTVRAPYPTQTDHFDRIVTLYADPLCLDRSRVGSNIQSSSSN